jgi:hypothetical protein
VGMPAFRGAHGRAQLRRLRCEWVF